MQRRPWYKGPFVLPWLSSLAALMAGGVLLLSYAVRRVTAPLSAVAEATRGFAGDAVGQPLPVTGPREVAEVAAACNGMRTRVASLVEERTRMLAALGHDLRTPLTRLRLRAETSADAVLREAVVREVERVDAMLTEAIAFALPGADGPRPDPIDLAGFAATLCDAYADLGHGVSYTGPSRMPALAPEASLDRILTNLVDNGLRHGARVEVSLRAEAGAAVLVVADDGPGIPVEARARVLEPFYTTDHARRRTGQGFGLGLSIVRDLARRMGGDVALGDGPHGRGLAVTVTLPVLLPGARAA
jgi:signal transduction histidine kinase